MKDLRQRLFCLLLALSACAFAAQAQTVKPGAKATPPAAAADREANAANWKEFTSTAGRFSILFPDKPAETTESLGAVDAHIVGMQTFAVYSVMYADYPEPIGDQATARRILDDGVKSAVDSVSSQLLETKEIVLDGNPGRYLKERMPDGKILRAKMLLVGQRLYQIAITTPEEQGQSAEKIGYYDSVAARYLDSFKLIAGQK